MIETRISGLSCNKQEFEKIIPQYQDILNKSGYRHKLQYKEESNVTGHQVRRKGRKRKIIWYTPP